MLVVYIPRDELIDVIVRNGMVEEFASWIKKKLGDDCDPISLEDVDYEYLLHFAIEKKLINVDELPEYIKDAENLHYPDIDDKELEMKRLPRKIRRKT